MRIIVTFRFERLRLPLACGHIIQSFIYRVLSAEPGYSGFVHDAGYRAGHRSFKLFSFRPPYGSYALQGRDILFHNGASFELRSPDAVFIQTFLAACRPGTVFSLCGQEVTVASCRLENVPALQTGAAVTTLSPVTVHRTDEDRHTIYYSPEDAAFYDGIIRNAQRKWQSFYGDAPFLFSIEPMENTQYRRLVTTFKGIYITAWYGSFVLHGTPQVLAFLYDTGLGSRNSQGFGMFEPKY